MTGVQPELDGLSGRILERALIRLERLREELIELRYRYRDREDVSGLKTLVEAMLVLTSEAERTVLQRSRELWDALQEEGAEHREAHEAFRGRIGGLMNSIESAIPSPLQVARRSHGRDMEALVGPFTREVARMVDQDRPAARELIFEPAEDYGFQLSLLNELKPLAVNFSPALRELLGGLPQLTVIAYPAQLESETLVHAVLAHEVAHVALHRSGPLGQPPRAQEAFAAARLKYRERLREQLVLQHGEDDADRRVRAALRRLRKWFEELACDALAVRLVGPSYVFALAALDVPSNRWGQLGAMAGEDSHPGLAWRLKRLVPLARDYVDDSSGQEAWKSLDEGLNHLADDIPDEKDELTDLEREIIEHALTEIPTPVLVEILDPAGYDVGVLRNDLDIVWDKMSHDIPPAERIAERFRPGETNSLNLEEVQLEEWSEPIDWRSVLNGAWAWWLAGCPLRGVAEGRQRLAPIHPELRDRWLEFNAFVRGTIELGDMHERLQDVRNRLDVLNPPEED